MIITIKGRLPSRNEAEKAARSGWQVGAQFKKKWTEYCAWHMQGIKPIPQPCSCVVSFYEKDYRRDPDNVISGLKYILDALQMVEIISNDSHKLLKLEVKPVELDKTDPRIEIELKTL